MKIICCRSLGLIYLLCLSVNTMAIERVQSITLKVKIAKSHEVIAGFDPVSDGAEMDLAVVGTRFIIYVNTETESDFGSVKIELTGPVGFSKIQNSPPWTVLSTWDDGTKTLVPGTYTLSCTPYSENALQGEPGETYSIGFTVVESGPFTGYQVQSRPVQPLAQEVTPSWFREESSVNAQEVELSTQPAPEKVLIINLSDEIGLDEGMDTPVSALKIVILLVACTIILVPGLIVVVKMMS